MWKLESWVVKPVLRAWHARAAARVYAPGGAAFHAAEEDFEARSAKVQRVGDEHAARRRARAETKESVA